MLFCFLINYIEQFSFLLNILSCLLNYTALLCVLHSNKSVILWRRTLSFKDLHDTQFTARHRVGVSLMLSIFSHSSVCTEFLSYRVESFSEEVKFIKFVVVSFFLSSTSKGDS